MQGSIITSTPISRIKSNRIRKRVNSTAELLKEKFKTNKKWRTIEAVDITKDEYRKMILSANPNSSKAADFSFLETTKCKGNETVIDLTGEEAVETVKEMHPPTPLDIVKKYVYNMH